MKSLLFAFTLLTTSFLWAEVNDQDLSAASQDFAGAFAETNRLFAGRLTPLLEDDFAELSLILLKDNQQIVVNGLNFSNATLQEEELGSGRYRFSCSSGETSMTATIVTEHQDFMIERSFSSPYRQSWLLQCGQLNEFFVDISSEEGQLLNIWRIAYESRLALEDSVGLGFWTQSLSIVWPSNGDYYSRWSKTLNLTRGDHWDVVSHELGHAIYDMGELGAFGGGAHRIDECYSNELALSEGWASFFAAWLNIQSDDSDAQFEFLVPRRAPIHIEHVPADVCRGPGNEWRVMSYFWDVYDTHDDSESSQATFASMWELMSGKGFSSAREIHEEFSSSAFFERAELQRAWLLNL